MAYNTNINAGAPPLLWSEVNDALVKINENFDTLALSLGAGGGVLLDFETLNTSIIPNISDEYTLGSISNQWKSIFSAEWSDVPGSEFNGVWAGSAHIKGIGSTINLPVGSTIDGALIIDPLKTAFKTITVSGQSNIVADSFIDVLTLLNGTAIAITTDAASDTITITNTGVTSVVGGTGIGVSSATGVVTIANNGVINISGGAPVIGRVVGSGISISGTTTPTITNTGVVRVDAGFGIIVNPDPVTGVYTIGFNPAVAAASAFTRIHLADDTLSLYDIITDTTTDTLTLVSGYGIILTADPITDTVTFTVDQHIDIIGSVFADDSTKLVDAVEGRIVGPVFANVTGDVFGNVTGDITGNIFTNLIDSADSSAITVTPKMIFSSDVDVENMLTAYNGITLGNGSIINDTSAESIAFGYNAGHTQGAYAVALGSGAGRDGQGNATVAISASAGSTNQGNYGIAIGNSSGNDTQGIYGIAIGSLAGYIGQLAEAVAIGRHAGQLGQGVNAIAIGTDSGYDTQGTAAVSIGVEAGRTAQEYNGIAIGYKAGRTAQHTRGIAIGDSAGYTTQGLSAIAFGDLSGYDTQGQYAVAIGSNSGNLTQGHDAVAIGTLAGNNTQGHDAVAIGTNAGKTTQGYNGIAIGFDSGKTAQRERGIAIGDSAGYDTQGISAIAFGDSAGWITQGNYGVAIGSTAGKTTQGNYAVAIGTAAAMTLQGSYGIAIGNESGSISQGLSGVAIGNSSGKTSQGINAVSIGISTGNTGQGDYSIAIGSFAGETTQQNYAVAMGRHAGQTTQGIYGIAIGQLAGNATQNSYGVAIGYGAGQATQGVNAIAIGNEAGINTQSHDAIAIGPLSGRTVQSPGAIAIGAEAGNFSQGNYAIAIGFEAGTINQNISSIILNATGSPLNSDGANRLFIAPIRSAAATGNFLQYNASTKEVIYASGLANGSLTLVGGNISINAVTGSTNNTVQLQLNGGASVNGTAGDVFLLGGGASGTGAAGNVYIRGGTQGGLIGHGTVRIGDDGSAVIIGTGTEGIFTFDNGVLRIPGPLVGTDITISENTISSTTSNADLELSPNGAGRVIANGPLFVNGTISGTAAIGAVDKLADAVISGLSPGHLLTYNGDHWVNQVPAAPGAPNIPVSKILYVDKNRVDSYTATGGMLTPFLTIQAALNVATANTTILISPGTYTESIVIPDLDGLAIIGSSKINTIITNSGATDTITWIPSAVTGATVNKSCMMNLTVINTVGNYTIIIDASAVLYPDTFVADEFYITGVDFHGDMSFINTGVIYWVDGITTGHLNVVDCATFRVRHSEIGSLIAPKNFNVTYEGADGIYNGLYRNDCSISNGTVIFGNLNIIGHPILQLDSTSIVIGNVVGTGLTSHYSAGRDYCPSLALYGQVGLVGGGQGNVTMTFPDPQLTGTAMNVVDFSNAMIAGIVTFNKTNFVPPDARGIAQVTGPAQFDLGTTNSIVVNGYVALDLKGSTYQQSALDLTSTGYVDRSIITFIDAVVATTPGTTLNIVPQLPPGSTYAVSASPSSEITTYITDKTATSLKLVGSSAGTADVTIYRV